MDQATFFKEIFRIKGVFRCPHVAPCLAEGGWVVAEEPPGTMVRKTLGLGAKSLGGVVPVWALPYNWVGKINLYGTLLATPPPPCFRLITPHTVMFRLQSALDHGLVKAI